jgi:hypothetical protein
MELLAGSLYGLDSVLVATKYKNNSFNRNPMGRTKVIHSGRSGVERDNLGQSRSQICCPKRAPTLSVIAIPYDSRSYIGGAEIEDSFIWWLTQNYCRNSACVSGGVCTTDAFQGYQNPHSYT